MKNYIDLENRIRDKKIYRVMSIDRFLEMFESKKNILVKPCLWDDPYENFLFNSAMIKPDGTEYKSILRDRAYGQCWTLNIESDAMWRIYAPEKNGVKIAITIRKLFQSFYKSIPNYPGMSCFIGKVDYHPKNKLKSLIYDVKENGITKGGSLSQAKSLLIKRNAFKHEEEVRLIYLDPRNQSFGNLFRYTFDPLHLIEKITFDPRMSKSLYRVYKNHILGLGFRGELLQSGLYKEPSLL